MKFSRKLRGPSRDTQMKKPLGNTKLLGPQGVTLVELLISAAIFGVAALAMTSLFGMHAQRVNRLKNDSSLSESASGFFEALEGVLSSATHIAYCGCSQACLLSNSPENSIDTAIDKNCHYPEGGTDLCDPGVKVKRLLVFETEDAPDPGIPAPSSAKVCLSAGLVDAFGVVSTGTPDIDGTGMILRGCKRWMRLSFEAPTGNPGGSPAVAVTPGKLTLRYIPPGSATSALSVPSSSVLLAQIEGVYRVWCGMNAPTPKVGFNSKYEFGRGDTFTLVAKAKARALNDNSSANFEPWGPVDGTGVPAATLSAARTRFNLGIHRTYASETWMPNIGARGLMVGKLQSQKGCAKDGTTGISLQCCSGYFQGDPAGKMRCESTITCVVAGTAAANDDFCCSHMRAAGVCL